MSDTAPTPATVGEATVAASATLPAAPENPPEAAAPALSPEADGAPTAKPPPDAAATAEPAPVANGIGVLIVNLGTPDAADAAAVRRYLKEFLADLRVIENDTLLWKIVLNGIILPLRSRRKARDYKKIWNNEKNESPFKTITRSQAEKL
ncbi:MAG TPA: ferrochelatase, partial [Xanthobacteraceae bacterium]|nr:ferrochelatase [Xanthobacteraceae bacterium]